MAVPASGFRAEEIRALLGDVRRPGILQSFWSQCLGGFPGGYAKYSGRPHRQWSQHFDHAVDAHGRRQTQTQHLAKIFRNILSLYASHAPFGGNVVGLDAAAWRYFRKPAHTLTWAESAALAVLPNAPGLIYPGRNPDALRRKRDQLLANLKQVGEIDEETFDLAILEPLPGSPFRLPQTAYHLTVSEQVGRTVHSTLDDRLQTRINETVENRLEVLRRNHIRNAAVIVADNLTGEIRAYVGNGRVTGEDDGTANDLVIAPRSSGSILKPFLFAAMLREGLITPRTLIPDIPTQYSGFAPQNFDFSYAGAVPAEEALARSLNIPAVRMLKQYGVSAFTKELNNSGFTTIRRPPQDYGLSLILGGAEVTLFDLVQAYRRLALAAMPGRADQAARDLTLENTEQRQSTNLMDAGVAWATMEAMAMVTRPDELAGWQAFGDAHKIAWKTGTSHGFRDAWAVGITPDYTVAVWVGNANGEGRPGMTGLQAAAPLLFDVFGMLPYSGWFQPPEASLKEVDICARSGMRASQICGTTKTVNIPLCDAKTPTCTYCRFIHLDQTGRYRVNDGCYPPHNMVQRSVFELPPLQAWYYRQRNPGYQSPTEWLPGCKTVEEEQVMRLIYPMDLSRVLIPRETDGKREKVVIRAAHIDPKAQIHWHLDDRYLGKTTNGMHYMEIDLEPGRHTITLIDEKGGRYSRQLTVERSNSSLTAD